MMTLNGHHEGLSFFVNRVCNDSCFLRIIFQLSGNPNKPCLETGVVTLHNGQGVAAVEQGCTGIDLFGVLLPVAGLRKQAL